ncbi:protein FMC1 homolog [Ptychodera flava]|uniref:protein FMC1 homolog n=1 Tax=Ptychodera flava TaxID=63121 RepID=UPI00396A2402
MMASGGRLQTMSTFRSLLKELRHCHKDRPLQNTMAYNYIMDQYRKHQVTSKKICKGHNEMQHKAQTYATLLFNIRKYQELHLEHRGQGERSVKATAEMVGFELPKKPDTPS